MNEPSPEQHMGGDCYRQAFDLIMRWEYLGGSGSEVDQVTGVRLVHGIVTGQSPIEGLRFGHAWVELDTSLGLSIVYDPSQGRDFTMPAALYYRLGRIDPTETVHYSWDSARRRLLEHQHYGPWDPPVRDHRDPDQTMIARAMAAAEG